MSTLYTFLSDNLKPLCELEEGLQLCLYEPTRKLYVQKTVALAAKAYYERIAGIDSPYLSKVLCVREQQGKLTVVREYLSGDTLAHLLQAKGTLAPDAAITIITQICRGLEALHKNGLVHRDITPNNIILSPDGNARIIDYGIARAFDTKKSADTQILGTPGYAAPEQFGFSQSNAQTDIYAVGVLLNVMLTGKLPSEQRAEGMLGRIISKCIEIDAKQRYRDISELKLALENKAAASRADRFIKAIPGLRIQKTPLIPIAILLYMLAAVLTYLHFSTLEGGARSVLLGLVSYLGCAVIPFFCFHNFLGIWDKLPFTKGASKHTQRILFYTLGALSFIAGFAIFSFML